jgi:hypothetical protein
VRLLRPLVLEAAGMFGDAGVLQDALNLFSERPGPLRAGLHWSRWAALAALGCTEGCAEPAPCLRRRPCVQPPACRQGAERLRGGGRQPGAAGDFFYQRRPVAADVRGVVYKLAARSGAEQAWPALLQLYKDSRDPAERQQLLLALAHAPEEAAVNATLALALSPDVLSQDVGSLLAAVASHGGRPFRLAWGFVASKMAALQARFPGGGEGYSLGRALGGLAPLFLEQGDLALVQGLAREHPGLLPPQFLDTARENIQANRRWLNGGGEETCKWLAEQLK